MNKEIDYKKLYEERMEESEREAEHILSFLLVVCIVAIVFEIGLLVIGYIYADKVQCNLIWCSFTYGEDTMYGGMYSNSTMTSITSINYYSNTTTTSKCYSNSKEINCSELDK